MKAKFLFGQTLPHGGIEKTDYMMQSISHLKSLIKAKLPNVLQPNKGKAAVR